MSVHTDRSLRRPVAFLFAAIATVALSLTSSGGFRIGAQAPDPCAPPNGNPIACENAKPGAPSTEWDVDGAGDTSIQGFTTDISVNRGQAVSFKISTNATNYRLDIYRMGYYGGFGARKIATVNPSVTLPQTQPACLSNATTGLFDCGNWAVSATWTVPSTAVSGIYFARLSRLDTGGASHIVFVVRDDASHADLLFQTSDTTWEAYNQYGGNSLYVGAPGTNPGRAYKVSYNRPNTVRDTAPEDSVFNAEYPMVRWLESNGYNVSYMAGVDTDRSAAALLQHKVFLSVGHDEYWSGQQRANVEAARAAGVHLAFFSGNEVFWKTRWENSISTPATAYRTLVSYKETHAGAKIDPTPNVWTGSWEDPRFSPPADGGRPANALTGTLFRVNSGTGALKVPAAEGKLRFWRNTTVATQPAGATATLAPSAVGYEWDEDVSNAVRPAGLMRLSDTTLTGVDRLQDYGSTYAAGTANHSLTLYRHPSGALVFGAGTVQWSWGLDDEHDRGSDATSLAMQQATVNLFADMGVQPLTPASGIVPATPSSDTTAPTSTITTPSAGVTVPANTIITIAGSATDTGGGTVGGVEVSTDGGITWQRAVGRASWTYAWRTPTAASVTLKSRAVDDSGNLEQPVSGVPVTVGSGAVSCPCSLWLPTQTPTAGPESDANQVEVGTRFRADASGYITAIRFYKFSQNTGTHIGHLWTAGGSLLSTVTFAGESASGWQEATLSTPVAISANTYYVVSYNTTAGFYAGDAGYFATTGVDNGPLHAPQDGLAGANGVYKYGASIFPDQTFGSENYWVDVVFATALTADTTAPSVLAVSPPNASSGVTPYTTITATFTENVTNVSGTTFQLTGAGAIPATVTYASGARTATLTPNAPLAYSTTYTARLRSGPTGITDSAGNPLAADYVWTFTTGAAPPPPPNDGPGGPILIVGSNADPFSRYYAEILRAEGLNSFTATDVSAVTAAMLNTYDVVILGAVPLTATQVTMLSDWVNGGGNLIAMRPDKKLASLLGLTDASTSVSEGYLLVNTAAAPGAGIVSQSMQFHGAADKYVLNGATSVATLYADATTATANPAVTIRNVGTLGGQAAAFTYDLARSIVYTRQGNPASAGLERDGIAPIRTDDLFFGTGQADWVNMSKVAIPQADEQQRLLANLILHVNADKRPLPRFWYFPSGKKAAIVMTGDDHGQNGTAGRFDIYKANSPANCVVNNWECVRGTSYIYPDTPITSAEAAAYVAQGFEIAVHITTNCGDYTPASLEGNYAGDLGEFTSLFPNLPAPQTNRTHCVVWSDFDTQPQVALQHGIRVDTNYYYYPGGFVKNRPGFMTGSGMPMRFAKLDGTMIDVYQAATQMTDESDQVFPFTVDSLLDNAVGSLGYYGFFTANMHTDSVNHPGSAAIVASAQSRGVPVISAKQLLTWLDGRNGSSFGSLAWNGSSLSFVVNVGTGANGLEAMLPLASGQRSLAGISRSGTAVPWRVETIKGVTYAIFSATAGSYTADYGNDTTPPVITALTSTPSNLSSMVTWTTNEAADSTVDFGTAPNALTQSAVAAGFSSSHAVRLPNLTPGTTYYYRARSLDTFGNAATSPGLAAAAASFTTTSPATLNCPCTLWSPTDVPAVATAADNTAIEAGLKFRTSVDGFITAVRFYKGAQNTGTHVGHLWTSSGTLLSTATFSGETASGWQTATFPQPVAVSTNTTYVVSYFAPNGSYAADSGYFASQRVSGPLTALSATAGGGNGVFRYGGSGFPTETFNSTNYWVDVVFDTAVTLDTTAPAITGITAVPDAAQATVAWTTNEAATSKVSYGTSPNALGGTVETEAFTTSHSLTLHGLDPATTYYFRVTSSDQSGNLTTGPPAASAPGSFSTLATATFGCPCSVWTPADVPAQASSTDTDAVELGLKFRSADDGFVTGVRFYKGPLNTGSHTGTLWTATGTRLATVTFTNESATGWQQAVFSQPVAVTANTTYVVSYHTNAGGYSVSPAYFETTGVTSGPLEALSNGSAGGNGVFLYGPGGFPTQSFNSTNYWVDVTFVVSVPDAPAGVVDTTVTDFEAGAPAAGAVVSPLGNGDVTLNAAVSEGFSTSGLPAGWSSTAWSAGGASTQAGGTVSVDGALFGSDAPLVPDQSLTFKATFANDAFQHAGFALTFNEDRWAMFSTGSGGALWARTNNGTPIDTLLAGNWLGDAHTYAINWTSTAVVFSIDGAIVATHNVAITAPMRPVFSDYTIGAGSLVVDWARLGPYGTSGTFTSRVLDGGSVKNWTSVTSAGTAPSTGSLALSVRFGNTPVPDGTWSAFTDVAIGNAALSASSRYVQYRVVLTGTATDAPVFESIAFTGSDQIPPPAVSVADTSVVEGSSGSRFAVFTLSLSAASSTQVRVDYATSPGTAGTADFTASSGTAVFPAGTTSVPVQVPINPDTVLESSETFTLNLSNPTNATLGRSQAVGTIIDDDVPQLSIASASITEGDTGTVNGTFTVTLSGAATNPVTVNYATADGTAVSPADYAAVSGTLTIPAGATTGQIVVPITGDTLDELDEAFTVTLSAPVNATLLDATAIGTIVDNDPQPSLTINDVSVTEGDSGSVAATFTVRLSAASGRAVSVNYTTANGTATAGTDYTTSAGTLTFAPGTTTQTIAVSVLGDTVDEPNELFNVNLSGAVGATIADSQGVGTIIDNDPPSISINNVTVTEGSFGSVNAVFTLSLSSASTQSVRVNYATANQTAVANADYSSRSGTVTFAAGTTTQSVTVPVLADSVDEDNETFAVNLSAPFNGTIAVAQGIATIVDSSPTPSLAINDVTVTEGNSGTTAVFTITLSAASGRTVTVNYATANGSATSPADYTAGSGTVTFAPGTTSRTVAVAVVGDTLVEANETFTVNLSGAVNAGISDALGTGTIIDDDTTPTVRINDVSVTEGNFLTKVMTFTVTLSAVSGRSVTMNYATANGTATAGTTGSADYVAASGALTFNPGTVSQTISITVRGDTTFEGNETLFVNLSGLLNATFADSQGLGTILNDD